MEQIPGEEHGGIVLRLDQVGVSASIVEREAAAVEPPRLRMTVVDAGEPSAPVWTACIRVAVLAEGRPVVVGLGQQLDLRFAEIRSEPALQRGNELREAAKEFRGRTQRSVHSIEPGSARRPDASGSELVLPLKQLPEQQVRRSLWKQGFDPVIWSLAGDIA
jgi:hypothetical protein